MDSLASNALAVHKWLYNKLTALGLCGAYSISERSGETCLGVGLAVLLYLIMPTKAVNTVLNLVGVLGYVMRRIPTVESLDTMFGMFWVLALSLWSISLHTTVCKGIRKPGELR